jgi:nucleoside phosphorylase
VLTKVTTATRAPRTTTAMITVPKASCTVSAGVAGGGEGAGLCGAAALA